MAKVLECDCGYVARGDDDAELVASAQAHARNSHGMEIPAHLIVSRARTASAGPGARKPRLQR